MCLMLVRGALFRGKRLELLGVVLFELPGLWGRRCDGRRDPGGGDFPARWEDAVVLSGGRYRLLIPVGDGLRHNRGVWR